MSFLRHRRSIHPIWKEQTIYAHYASKEDLFLALMDQRVLTKFSAVTEAIEAESNIAKRPAIFRRFLTAQAADQAWGILILEFKPYALRRPNSREKLTHLYNLIGTSSDRDFTELLFGPGLEKGQRTAAERRLAILGAIISAANLESHFRPKLLSPHQLQAVLDELCESLIRL
jgi:AcrR family transcriptional regulator